MSEHSEIKALAIKCYVNHLNLRDACVLFTALYWADAIAAAGGNRAEAARFAGVKETAYYRFRRKRESGDEEGEEQ